MKISISLGSSSFTCSVVKVLAVFAFIIWGLISLYAFSLLFQVDPKIEAKDYFTTAGALIAGIGTLYLAFSANEALHSWKAENAVKYEHENLVKIKGGMIEFKDAYHQYYVYIDQNAKYIRSPLTDKSNTNELNGLLLIIKTLHPIQQRRISCYLSINSCVHKEALLKEYEIRLNSIYFEISRLVNSVNIYPKFYSRKESVNVKRIIEKDFDLLLSNYEDSYQSTLKVFKKIEELRSQLELDTKKVLKARAIHKKAVENRV